MPLQIFISHKMPADTSLAEAIAGKLALYAGNQVRVVHAGRFRYGENWRLRIQEELTKSDWVIFLHTDQDEDWGFCLYELGYFRKVMDEDGGKPRRLITFCRKPSQLNEALKEFNAQVITEDSVNALLGDIYLREPWRLSPELDPAALRATAAEMTAAFFGSERVEENFDVATSVTIELAVDEKSRAALKRNILPGTAVISGTREWQRLFGRDIDSGGWQWSDLISKWPQGEIYGFLIAAMIDDALDKRMPKGTILSTPEAQLHRLTLRRFERFAGNEKHKFYFTVAPADLPFEVSVHAEGRQNLTVIYHLMNVAWFFRRRIVEQIYERLLELATKPNRNEIEVTEIYDQLGRELMQVSAQAIIRQIDNLLIVRRALGEDDDEVRKYVEDLGRASELRREVYEHIGKGSSSLDAMVRSLGGLAELNHEFLQKIAKRFASATDDMKAPSRPAPVTS